MRINQKGNFILGLIIGVLIVGGLVGAYYLGTKKSSPTQGTINYSSPQPTVITSSSQPSPSPSVDQTADWKLYTSKYNFSFKYPPNWYLDIDQYEGEDNVHLRKSPQDKGTVTEILSFNGASLPMGCGPVEEEFRKLNVFMIGNQTTPQIQNFCGETNFFIINTKSASQKTIDIWAKFVGTSEEALGREVLKSVKGLTFFRPQ